MNGVRKLEVKTQVLIELRRADGIPMQEGSLLNIMRILITPAPLQSEVTEVLRDLESARLVVATRDSLESGLVKWSITDNGRARLADVESR